MFTELTLKLWMVVEYCTVCVYQRHYIVRRCRLHHWNVEDKYCTVKSETEHVDNEAVPVDFEAVLLDVLYCEM
jgi:hypothetical protein